MTEFRGTQPVREAANLFVNDGAPAMSARVAISPERKYALAERQVKIDDRLHGLAVLIESARPGVESAVVAKELATYLGENLSTEIENVAHSKASNKQLVLEALLKNTLSRAMNDADAYLAQSRHPASVLLLRRAQLGPDQAVLAYANVGGGRLYRWRGGELKQLVSPDTELKHAARDGRVSAPEAHRRDQADHPPAEARRLVAELGQHGRNDALDVHVLPLLSGDRLIALSGGAGFALTEEEIAAYAERGGSSLKTELALQIAAIERMKKPGQTRAEAGDVAAVVIDVDGHKAHEALAAKPEQISHKEHLNALGDLHQQMQKIHQEIEVQLRELARVTASDKKDEAEIARVQSRVDALRQRRTQMEHETATHELALLRKDVKPRYGIGDRIRTEDSRLHLVVGYDPAKDEYLLEDPKHGEKAVHHRRAVGRFDVEGWQPATMLPIHSGDVFPYAAVPGKSPEDWRVADGTVDADGFVLVSDPRGIRHVRVRALDIRHRLHDRIVFGADAVRRFHATGRHIAKQRHA